MSREESIRKYCMPVSVNVTRALRNFKRPYVDTPHIYPSNGFGGEIRVVASRAIKVREYESSTVGIGK